MLDREDHCVAATKVPAVNQAPCSDIFDQDCRPLGNDVLDVHIEPAAGKERIDTSEYHWEQIGNPRRRLNGNGGRQFHAGGTGAATKGSSKITAPIGLQER